LVSGSPKSVPCHCQYAAGAASTSAEDLASARGKLRKLEGLGCLQAGQGQMQGVTEE
jgi:hypothetical protein